MFRKPNVSSGIPIYKQIKDQIRHFIEIGVLKPGDQLPSIRMMAKSLIINPNTIIRIYNELEQENIIVISHGLGAFIADASQPAREELLRDAQLQLTGIIEKLTRKGLDHNEIRRLVEAVFTENESLLKK